MLLSKERKLSELDLDTETVSSAGQEEGAGCWDRDSLHVCDSNCWDIIPISLTSKMTMLYVHL
jgi:hypothetical protein